MQRDPHGTALEPPRVSPGAASTTQFLSRDRQLQYADGMNLYQYVRSNPLASVDPTGLYQSATNCTASQEAAIKAAESSASSTASSTYSLVLGPGVQGGPGNYRDRAWLMSGRFPGMNRIHVKEMLEITSKLGIRMRSITEGFSRNEYGVECECSCEDDKDAYVNLGILRAFDDDIHFCPSFFGKGASEQAQIFLHEMSHMQAGAGHGHSSFREAPDDAYWYEQLVAHGPRRVLDGIGTLVARGIYK